MNSIPRRVLQFWSRENGDWSRRSECERAIACQWAQPDSDDPDFARE